MAKEQVWIAKKRERMAQIRSMRNALIVRLSNDELGFGPISHEEIAMVINVTQPSVSRLLKSGKNISRPVATI